MKNILILLTVLLPVFNCSAQYSLIGDWNGTLDVNGAKLTLVLHIKDAGSGAMSGTWDSPAQGVYEKPCSSVTLSGDTATIAIAVVKGKFKGVFKTNDEIGGVWMQGGMIPMTLSRGDGKDAGPKRPQNPKPPFNYTSEDILYYNADSSIRYGATITIPKGDGPFPAVLLITGSGQQNRDEELLGHKPFAVIADHLTNNGYVVLRVDDRGMGQTTGEVHHATTRDFADDATVSFNYLLSRKEVDKKKAGLLGHSEGGMIAEMMAAENKHIDFIIMMAGPGEKLSQAMIEQNEALLQSKGISQRSIDKYIVLYKEMVNTAISTADSDRLRTAITEEVKDWKYKTPDSIVVAITGIHDETSEAAYIDLIAKLFAHPWWHYFLSYDPVPDIEKISCKVLALNGDKDIQVVPKTNLQGLREALAKSKSKDYEVKLMPGLNHLFQTCHTCTFPEYQQLEETVAPVALQTMSDWLDKHVK